MTNSAVQHLLAEQRPDGGWGAYSGSPSRTESTALCTLALRTATEGAEGGPGDAARAAARAGIDWLVSRQTRAGGWPVADEVPGPSWPTSLAALALAGDEDAASERRRAGLWLLEQKGRGTSWWVRLLLRIAPERMPVALDPNLTGWPWVGGTFSWVEPTAYALIALKRLRPELPASRTTDRIDEAERMLLDRVCPDGGWNYGNAEVFGDSLWPYPDTTALGVLALADRPELPEVRDALGALERMLGENESMLALGLGALAFESQGQPAARVRERLEARLLAWEGGELRSLAWAALAASGSTRALGVGRA